MPAELLEKVGPLGVAVLLAIANKTLVDYLAEPIRQRYPDLNLWFIPYVAFVTGLVIGMVSGTNLFVVIPGLSGLGGQILTACVIGGGSSLIHDIFDTFNGLTTWFTEVVRAKTKTGGA